MTEEQKVQIVNLRGEGYGYVRIALALGISENTVKSFCRRKKLAGKAETTWIMQLSVKDGKHFCLFCGKEVEQNPGRKEKKFCSDGCRNKWWNSHLDRVNRKANYEFVCPQCKKHFTAYGNAGRKYCSHECYIAHRLGGVARMTEEQFRNEKLYQATMSIARRMFSQGLILEEEYRQIDTIFLEKYHPVFGTLFSGMPLTSGA